MTGTLRKANRFLTARGCLDLLWASWDSRLISPTVRAAIDSMSTALPPIPRVGLELRLGTGEARVDLHQLVTRADGDLKSLVGHFTAGGMPRHGKATDRLRAFLQLWSEEGSSFGEVFPQFYVEFDLAKEDAPPPLPCLFFDVHGRLENRADRAARESLIIEVIEQLHGGITQCRRTALERCFAAVDGRGSTGHVGLMLGRDAHPIRLNIKDLRRGALLPLLGELGWMGNRATAAEVFHGLLDEVDLVTVALDLLDDWLPVIGFEAFLRAHPETNSRWQLLFSRLRDEGLCTPDEHQSLLRFPGTVVPGPSGPRWPASWLVAATLAPADHQPVFRREISHIKITLDAAGKSSAKAYLGMHHAWRTPPVASEVGTRAPALKTPLTARIATAVEGSHDFLMGTLSQGDFWRDFQLDIGSSDEWVTAFVASQLAITGLPRGLTAAHGALSWLLRRQRPCGGWGYNSTAPPDADSTAWALRLAIACGVETDAARRARAFLAGHLLPDGSVTTYSISTPIRLRDRSSGESGNAGWRAGHSCVAANAAPLLGRGALDALRRSQTACGSWRAYWWQSDMFATALAAESLFASPHPGNVRCVERAIAWAALQNPKADTPCFDIAWSLRLALLGAAGSRRPEIELHATRLLDLQDADGGWPAGAPMLFPRPCDVERVEGLPLFIDQERNFTTATVQAALAMAANELAQERQVPYGGAIPLRAAAAL
jgi:Prenyltransferase and squalene oxidase repeat